MAKILIVDDDVAATNLLNKILSTEGHEPIIVNDSAKAMQFASYASLRSRSPEGKATRR